MYYHTVTWPMANAGTSNVVRCHVCTWSTRSGSTKESI